MTFRTPHVSLALLAAVSLMACATAVQPGSAPVGPAAASAAPAGASAVPTGAAKPAAAPVAPQAAIARSQARVPRPIPDPAAGKSFKASQYWDYEVGTPYEIEDTTIRGAGDADHDGRTETTIVGDVKLPAATAQAKLVLLGKASLAQADGDDDDAGDPGDGDAAGLDDAAWEDEIDEDEVEEEIDEDEDDIVWEDDWFVDGDGDGAWEEGDVAYAEEYDEAEEDTFLTAPHTCEMAIQDAPMMSNMDDQVVVTDTKTGEKLTISYDQEFAHVAIRTSKGAGELEYLPDGSFMLDGQPAADVQAVAQALRAKPWFRATSRYALAMVAARLGRMPEAGTRTAAVCSTNGCVGSSDANHGNGSDVEEEAPSRPTTRRLLNMLVAEPDAR